MFANTARLRSLTIISLVCLGSLAAPGLAGAATFTVTKTADTADGTCNADCSLREAINAANASAGVLDTVTLPAGAYTLTGAAGDDANASGDLDITSIIQINGAGKATTTIDANDVDRALHVLGASMVLRDVTVEDGRALSGDGAGILIDAVGQAQSLFDVIVRSSTAFGSGSGGGAWIRSGNLQITGSRFTDNAAGGSGGGLYVAWASGGGISRSVIDNNDSSIGGGAMLDGPLLLDQLTFYWNTAKAAGGGLVKHGTASTTVRFATFGRNYTDMDFTGDPGGGAFDVQGGTLTLSDSLFAFNQRFVDAGTSTADICHVAAGATLTTLGHNVTDSTAGCDPAAFGHASDRVGGSLNIGAFEAAGGNGLPVLKFGLTSRAIDASGGSAGCNAIFGGDQRGSLAARERTASCDAGAFELGGLTDNAAGISAPATGNVGSAVTVSPSLTALGPDPAKTAAITITLPATVASVSAPDAVNRDCSVASNVVTCTILNTAVGSTASVPVTFTPTVTGAATVQVLVEAYSDRTYDNEDASATLTIGEALPPPPTTGGETGGSTGTTNGTTIGTGTGTGGGTTPPPAPDTIAPRFSSLLAPTRALRRSGTLSTRLARGGTTANSVKVVLNERGSLRIQVLKSTGAKIGLPRTLTNIPSGTSYIGWGGKVGARVQPYGCYKWQVQAIDAAGNRSVLKTIRVCLA